MHHQGETNLNNPTKFYLDQIPWWTQSKYDQHYMLISYKIAFSVVFHSLIATSKGTEVESCLDWRIWAVWKEQWWIFLRSGKVEQWTWTANQPTKWFRKGGACDQRTTGSGKSSCCWVAKR